MHPPRDWLIFVAVFVQGCLPPDSGPAPGATIESVARCEGCAAREVRVVVAGGDARPGARVVVEDLDRTSATGQRLAREVLASATGAWRVTLGPQREPAESSERVAHVRDTVAVYEVWGDGYASPSRLLEVPLPPEQDAGGVPRQGHDPGDDPGRGDAPGAAGAFPLASPPPP